MPEEVVERSPNPEMLPGIEDKYLDVFAVPAPTVDLVLWGIEHGMGDAAIARDVGLAEEKVRELRDVVRLSAHMRSPSMAPELDLSPVSPPRT